MPTGEFWEYDPALDTWTELPPHPGPSRWAPASFIIDDWIYLVAGMTVLADFDANTYRYHLGSASSVTESVLSETLQLSPMPFHDVLMLPIGVAWEGVKIYSLTGAEVLTPTVSANVIELSELREGVYILEVLDGDRIYRQRISKM